jgi:hypothetical protein
MYDAKQMVINSFWSMNELLRTDSHLDFITKALADGQVTWADLPFTEDELRETVLKCRVHRAVELFGWMKAREYVGCDDAIRKLLQDNSVTWADLPFTEDELKAEERTESIHLAEILFRGLKLGRGTFTSHDVHNGLLPAAEEICRRVNLGKVKWSELSFTEAELLEAEQKAATQEVIKEFKYLQKGKWQYTAKRIRRIMETGKVNWVDLPFTEADLQAEEISAKPTPPMKGMMHC